MVKRVVAARGGSVITRGLVGKIGEGKRVWVEERGCESPLIVLRPWRGIKVLDSFLGDRR